MNRHKALIAVGIFLCLSSTVIAGGMKGETGLLFGADHAFEFTATTGWLLDNKGGVQQGLHMVFYPIGYSWANSPVIAYGRSVKKTNSIKSIPDQVNETVKDFQNNGSPKYRSKVGEQLKLHGNHAVHIYFFSGDQWGNYEAVGYIEEEKTINFLVFNSRKKEDFDKYLADFKSILLTYENRYSNDVDNATFTRLVEEAKKLSVSNEGSNYEHKLMNKLGPSLANIMRDCTSYASKEENTYFELVLRIKKSGKIMEMYAKPSNGLTSCVKGMMAPIILPSHDMDTFVEYIEMKIED